MNLKLLHTSTFRMAAIYLILFALSVGAILSYVYWNTAVLLGRQTDETVRAEVQGLADQYNLLGLPGIIDTIQRRSREDTSSIYLLTNPKGERVAGNLDLLPPQATSEVNWFEFPITVVRGGVREQHVARAYHVKLGGGQDLIVGRDVAERRQFANIIRNTLFGALALALVLGLGGGLLVSRNFLRRVDAITDASRGIMGGNIAGRMPVSGTDDELDRLARALNEMLDQIERLMKGMQEVSSNVAHDLKTPLTRVKARVESALRSKDPEDYREALEKTVEESDRLLQTFNSLLSIARAESGQARSSLEPIDVRSILADVAELYEPLAEEEGGSLRIHADKPLTVLAERQLFAQAINNLIDNALKYGTREGKPPEIDVSGDVVDGKVVITVADNGPGIPERDRQRVIERFVRLDESRSLPGNGLGLSLVSGVMKLHGGNLVLGDNNPGLRASLELPLYRAES